MGKRLVKIRPKYKSLSSVGRELRSRAQNKDWKWERRAFLKDYVTIRSDY